MDARFDTVLQAIGHPTWSRDGLALYTGDCTELMSRVPVSSVGLTITSPPYNIGYVADPDAYTFNLDDVRDPSVKYPNQKKNGKIRVNPNGKNPSDVWIIPKVTTGAGMTGRRASPERTAHPAQFPLDVIRRIILACSRPGDIILDPFAGSGSTLLAAYETGRSCIGFEIEPRYVEMAAERLDASIDRPVQASWLTSGRSASAG